MSAPRMGNNPTSNPTSPTSPPPASGRGARHPVLWRVLGLTGAIAAVVGLAFLVGRPHGDHEPVAVTFTSTQGPRPPGLEIFLQRDATLAVLDPATELHAGDGLRFVVRGSAPRYLVVRARDGAGRDQILFPHADANATTDRTAALVRPAEALPDALAIDGTAGKMTITALFASHPFLATARPTPDVQVVTIDLMKAP